jgi:hypothetical protein
MGNWGLGRKLSSTARKGAELGNEGACLKERVVIFTEKSTFTQERVALRKK